MNAPYQQRRQPPKEKTALYDEASERIVVGYFLLNPDSVWDFTDSLKPEHFSTARLGRIWAAMLACCSARKPVTKAMVNLLIKGDSGEDTLLKIYLEIITDEVRGGVRSTDIMVYVETVILLADKRAMIEALQRAIDQVETSGMDTTIDDIRDDAMSVLTSTNPTGIDRYMRTYAQVAHSFAGEISEDMKRSDEGITRGLNPGLAALNDVMGPLMPGGVYVIAGMSGGGKTALTKGIIESASLDAKLKGLGPVYMASMEMTGRQHAARSMAAHLGLPSYKLERSDVNLDEYDRIEREGVRFMSQFPIVVDEKPRLTLIDIRTRMLKLRHRGGICLGVIDHLLLVRATGKRDSLSDRIMEAATEMKSLARELEIPILVLSQVKEKEVMQRKSLEPNAADLFGGEAIQQNADFTGFIHRPEITLKKRGPDGNSDSAVSDWEVALERLKGKAFFYSDKGRSNGAGMRRELRFNGPAIAFEDY